MPPSHVARSSESLVQPQLRVLSAAVPLAAAGDADAVHRARVASRRLREVLPVVASRKALPALTRAVRRITEALGPVRELDVTLGLLETAVATKQISRRAAAALRQALMRRRALARTETADGLEGCHLGRLQKGTLAAVRRRPRLMEADARLSRRADRLVSAIAEAGGLYVPEYLHEIRIALKKLRYATEVLAVVRGTPAVAPLRLLKRGQDILGRMHDLDVLTAEVRALQGAADAPSLSVCADLDRYVRVLDGECRHLHGQYMSLRDRLLRVCEDASDASRAQNRVA
ncbi:MAG: CHAD domain-containing protein [Vicinamibacterales bacterium]